MIPYFFPTNEHFLSYNCKNNLIDESFERIDDFVSYVGQGASRDTGINFLRDQIVEHQEIKDLVNSCSLKCYPVVLMVLPHTKLSRHVDDPNKRNCVLSIPLYPTANFPPMWFWKPEGITLQDWQTNNLELLATCNFENMTAAFLNTQQVHSVHTFDDYRFNFQLCFNDSFEIVVDKYQQKNLFDFQLKIS
jgi:hypothetical protein